MKAFDFRRDGYGDWHASLSAEYGVFHSRTLGINIGRLHTSEQQPNPVSLALLAKIIVELPSILPVAEREFSRYELDSDPSWVAEITIPYIWISGEEKDPNAWTFVVERADWPDYGCHIEFRGNQFSKIWAGD